MARFDKHEAREVAQQQLDLLAEKSYDELVQNYMEPVTLDRNGSSGVGYQLEVNVFWDDERRENIRVIVAADNGGWSAFKPVSVDFIMSPSGELVGE